MLVNRKSAAIAASLTLFALAAHGQTIDWAKQTYRTSLMLKAKPGQTAALAEFYKTGAGAKTIQARLKANPKLQSWALLRNVYPGESGVEVDHRITVTLSGAPSEPNQELNERAAREGAGMSYADYMSKVRSMTDQVGQTLSHVHHSTSSGPLAEGDYIVIRRIRFHENKRAAMYELARDRMHPLAEDQVKSAGSLKSWSFSHVAFPMGDGISYDATESRVYKDLASAVATGGTGNAGAMRFAKKFPNQSYNSYIDSLRASSKIARTELYRVVAVHSR